MKSILTPQNKSKLVEDLRSSLDQKSVEKIARSSKFVQRKSPLTGWDFLLTNVFNQTNDSPRSLEGLCNSLAIEGVEIRKQSLQDRYNEAGVEFIKSIAGLIFNERLRVVKGITNKIFSSITIFDSTQIELPSHFSDKYKGSGGGASTAAVKLQYGYDILNQQILNISVHSAIERDSMQPLYNLKKTS